jgi:hypothetical protein
MSKQEIKKSQIKLLWGKSAGKCSICRINLSDSIRDDRNFQFGEMAHIEGENPGSARFNIHMTDDARSSYENLILLCPTHHGIIDKNDREYTVVKLKQIKEEHEKWVEDSLRINVPEVTFAELEVIIKYLVDAPISGDDNLTIVPPNLKIKKNNLSPAVGRLITLGMVNVSLIEKYLNTNPDIQFSRRLRRGFVDKYTALKNEGFEADALFYTLLDFASNNSQEFRERTAGLSILAYFFERCMVFEL